MKFIKNHLMFILPLMAILFSIEFYLVFERTTKSYEKILTEGYSMLVVTKRPMTLKKFQRLNHQIRSLKEVERSNIISQVSKGMTEENAKKILAVLPYFYNLGLQSYVHTEELAFIKKDLQKSSNIKKVETFDSAYEDSYRLFSFIKFMLKVFIVFMAIVSLFLILKQMQIWKYAHKERMQVMEIFGAPLMLRSGVLFRMALIDAIISALFISSIFYAIQTQWALESHIDIITQNYQALFKLNDIGILMISAITIVVVSVYLVVHSSKGEQE